MSGLPENLDNWPKSPYEILSVTHKNNEREVRSAYVRLIKVYKPEKYPEQFQRIREAYDQIIQHLKMMRSSDDEIPQLLRFGHGIQVVLNDNDDNESAQLIGHHSEQNEFSTATASVEQIKKVYLKLVRQTEKESADYTVYAQLHWMAFCFPEFDTDRTPFDWLVNGMEQIGFDGRLMQILQARVELEPQLALEDNISRLMQSQDDKNLLITLANLRWPIAARHERLDLIDSDFDSLKKIVLDEHQDAVGWIRLMAKAHGDLGWILVYESHRLRERCQREIERLNEHHFDVDHDLDRMDFLAEIQSVWSTMRVSTFPTVKRTSGLIPVTWNHRYGETSTAELDRTIIEWSEKILEQPGLSMTQFDEFSRMDVGDFDGTLIMQYLIDYLDDYVIQRVGFSDSDLSNDTRIRSFFDSIGRTSYANLRLQLFGFCSDEWIDPGEIVSFIGDHPQYQTVIRERGMLFALLNDSSLNLLLKAHRAFWC